MAAHSQLDVIKQTSLALPEGSYIYDLCRHGSDKLAAISSDNSLRCFDRRTLELAPHGVVRDTHSAGVTGLAEFAGSSNLLVTGGNDGAVRMWDLREGKDGAVVEFNADKSVPVTAIACNAENMSVAAGTEYTSRQASVLLWDVRSPVTPRLSYVESHNDDITEVEFHPSNKNILMSGSTDGLVNIYDTTIEDEEDALKQVINHGSIHHAGFLGDGAVYALSHDESFAIHPLDNFAEEAPAPPSPIQFGDVRQLLGCSYAVQVLSGQGGVFLASGITGEKPGEQRLDLTPIVPDPKWQLLPSKQWQLLGAHGEEIVRSVFIDDEIQTVFSCGEDGIVRAWRGKEDTLSPSHTAGATPKDERSSEPKLLKKHHGKAHRSKEGKNKKHGFKPY